MSKDYVPLPKNNIGKRVARPISELGFEENDFDGMEFLYEGQWLSIPNFVLKSLRALKQHYIANGRHMYGKNIEEAKSLREQERQKRRELREQLKALSPYCQCCNKPVRKSRMQMRAEPVFENPDIAYYIERNKHLMAEVDAWRKRVSQLEWQIQELERQNDA